jgi:dephospho-CoA kinase
MLRGQALVDYERLRRAKVAIFIDSTDVARCAALLEEHGEAVRRLADLFGAEVLLAEEGRLLAERIVESEFADAWVVLVNEGRGRALTTKRNSHRFNLDYRGSWEPRVFRELLRQIHESTRIHADVTAYYSRYVLPVGDRHAESRPRTN